jgi:hypothetical protein
LRGAIQAASKDSDLLFQQVCRKSEYVARNTKAHELSARKLTNSRQRIAPTALNHNGQAPQVSLVLARLAT